jgi:glutamate dehydrogenase
MFDLPRSSWADYDPELLSPGGGVWERKVKEIPLSNEARLALGLAPDGPLTPDDVVRAILQAPVDLLFNGGIGTFVKASTQSAVDVGDKTNDAVRIDGRDLRCMVVGEGGNLGLTQAGRIEAAQHGVRINTDAIDNSAGVDTSDHEVNLKILLDRVVAAGDLTVKQRNSVLVEVTDEVAALVLRNNYEQNVLLGNARSQAAALLPVHQRMIQALESSGRLDRGLEGLPDDEEIGRRLVAGEGLTSPEFCVLVAYSKNHLTWRFTDSTLPEDPWFSRRLRDYFPKPVAERFADSIETHPLRRQIIATTLASDLVDRGGITFAFRAVEESGSDYESVARAFTVAREVFGLPQMYAEVESLDNRVPTQAQVATLLEMRRLLDRAVRWLIGQPAGLSDITGLIERYAPTVQKLIPSVPDLLQGGERDRMERRANELAEIGVPEDLAVRTSVLLDVFGLLDITDIAAEVGEDPESVAALYFVVSERMSVDALLLRITALPRNDRWQAMARMSLRDDLYAAHKALTRGIAADTPATEPPEERLGKWEERHAESVDRLVAMLQEISNTTEGEGLAPLSVGLRVLRSAVE